MLKGRGYPGSCDGDLRGDGCELERDVVCDDVGATTVEVLADPRRETSAGGQKNKAARTCAAKLERAISAGSGHGRDGGALDELNTSSRDDCAERIGYSPTDDDGVSKRCSDRKKCESKYTGERR